MICNLVTYRYRVCVVYLKLSVLVVSVGRPGGEQVEKRLEQIHVLPANIGDLKDWTHPVEDNTNMLGKISCFTLTLNLARIVFVPL